MDLIERLNMNPAQYLKEIRNKYLMCAGGLFTMGLLIILFEMPSLTNCIGLLICPFFISVPLVCLINGVSVRKSTGFSAFGGYDPVASEVSSLHVSVNAFYGIGLLLGFLVKLGCNVVLDLFFAVLTPIWVIIELIRYYKEKKAPEQTCPVNE